jgi:RIO kinase 1
VEAGVRVPKPFGYFNDTLVMELVTDAAGDPAPRLGEVDLTPEVAREYHASLIRRVVRMLCIGLIHGDLSEFNVLVAADGPVIIDLPQAVNAAGKNQAFAMLERDVNNLRGTLGRFTPELLETEYARETLDAAGYPASSFGETDLGSAPAVRSCASFCSIDG